MIKVMTSTEHPSQTDGTSPTMTNGQPMPEDVWQAILRLEAKRIRQAEANPTYHMDQAFDTLREEL